MRPWAWPGTIAAVATGRCAAGMAVVRVSGPEALGCARALASLPDPMPSREAMLRTFRDREGRPFDRGLVLYFPASSSFTGEEIVELHGHGGILQAARLLEAVQAAGARAAEPGEFTRRAVENGRMTLAEAEAMCDLAAAETEAGLEAARSQLFGAVEAALAPLREEAVSLVSEVQASLDFPEDVDTPGRLAERARALGDGCRRLGATHREGRALREGIRVALVGAPNVGKSSLFNRLVGSARAIVDPEPGTTRDALEARIDLAGVPCTLVDTAGLRETAGRIEALGVARALEEGARADLILWVYEAGGVPGNPPEARLDRVIRVANKVDLNSHGISDGALPVSAMTGDGIVELQRRLRDAAVGDRSISGGEWIVTQRRHAELLSRAAQAFFDAAEAPVADMAGIELQTGLDTLDAILGRGASEEVLDEIFSRFCIGK